MKNDLQVLHIIPAAFGYFDDIKDYAFGLVGEMNKYKDISANVFTLQYGPPTHSEKEEVDEVAPGQEYAGSAPVGEIIDDFSLYDIVHLHAPFLGAAKRILQWKKDFPEIPLVITLYRDVPSVDLIAWGIKWYNNYYLPKLFKQADLVTVFPWSEKKAKQIAKQSKAKVEIELLTEFGAGNPEAMLRKHLKQKEIVQYFFKLYSYFI
jgi:hypothetical protein